jgi:hypothetical protein
MCTGIRRGKNVKPKPKECLEPPEGRIGEESVLGVFKGHQCLN